MKKNIIAVLLIPFFLIFLSVQRVYAGGTVSLIGNPYVGNEISIVTHLDTKDCPSNQTEFKIENLNVDQKDATLTQTSADLSYESAEVLPLDFTNSDIHTLVNGTDLGGFKYIGTQVFVAWFPNSTATADDDPVFFRNDDLQIIVTKVKVAQPGIANINATVHLAPDWDTCVSLHSYTAIYDMPKSSTSWYSYKPEYNFTFINPPSVTPTSIPTSTPVPSTTPIPIPTTPVSSPTPTFGIRFPTFAPLERRFVFPTIVLFPQNTPVPLPVASVTPSPIASDTPIFVRHMFR